MTGPHEDECGFCIPDPPDSERAKAFAAAIDGDFRESERRCADRYSEEMREEMRPKPSSEERRRRALRLARLYDDEPSA